MLGRTTRQTLFDTKCFKSRFAGVTPPRKSVNLSFTMTYMKNKLTNLCGN